MRDLVARHLEHYGFDVQKAKDGIKGHTFAGNDKSMYSIEMTSKHNPIVKKLDPETGFDVRTNHGEDHENAGYTPKGFPEDYVSSKVRKAAAAAAIADVEDYKELMPSIATQQFEPESNYNTMRKVDGDAGMRTSSQVMILGTSWPSQHKHGSHAYPYTHRHALRPQEPPWDCMGLHPPTPLPNSWTPP